MKTQCTKSNASQKNMLRLNLIEEVDEVLKELAHTNHQTHIVSQEKKTNIERPHKSNM